MKIIGFAINKILAEKKKTDITKIEIKNNLTMDNITEEKVEIFDKTALKFDFSYIISYEPGFAEIKLAGSIIGLDENNESKKIIQEWKEKKTMGDFKIEVINAIMNECILKALSLEKELGLPFHIPFPKLKKEIKNSINPANYTG